MQEQAALNDETIIKLAKCGIKIEKHFGVPQDIEWALDDDGKIYILQARPETVHGKDSDSRLQKGEIS